jgi:hypothetical protein
LAPGLFSDEVPSLFQDSLKPLEGKLRDKSESRKQFDGRQAEKVAPARPADSMFQDGDFNWETNKRSDFRQHELQRQELSRARDNLRPLEGKLADETEARCSFHKIFFFIAANGVEK